MPSDSWDAFPGKGYISRAGEAGRGVGAVCWKLQLFLSGNGAKEPRASGMGAEDPHTSHTEWDPLQHCPGTGAQGADDRFRPGCVIGEEFNLPRQFRLLRLMHAQ